VSQAYIAQLETGVEDNPELDTLIQDMFETNEAAHGAGLAATQIGDDRRVFIYDCPDNGTRRRGYAVNPQIETSEIPTNMPDPDDDSEDGEERLRLPSKEGTRCDFSDLPN